MLWSKHGPRVAYLCVRMITAQERALKEQFKRLKSYRARLAKEQEAKQKRPPVPTLQVGGKSSATGKEKTFLG